MAAPGTKATASQWRLCTRLLCPNQYPSYCNYVISFFQAFPGCCIFLHPGLKVAASICGVSGGAEKCWVSPLSDTEANFQGEEVLGSVSERTCYALTCQTAKRCLYAFGAVILNFADAVNHSTLFHSKGQSRTFRPEEEEGEGEDF